MTEACYYDPAPMSSGRVAIFSVHSSPLAQPGSGDGGGMSVYVRSLASALARAGIDCDVLTRADAAGLAPVVEVEPGFCVHHVVAGPTAPVARHDLPSIVDTFTDRVADAFERGDLGADVLHANYWISGGVAHRLKHALGLPLVATFHTLARVKAEAGIDDDPARRARVEHEVIDCADLILASTEGELEELSDLYGADPSRIEIVPPGVDHELFRPAPDAASRAAERARLHVSGRRVLLFVGRIQPLKGADLAVRCLAELDDPAAVLLVVGGPSGPDGHAEHERLHHLVHDLGLDGRVRFVAPQPHRNLARYYRAADVCLVPSRTESFGLVALEAAACGTPVVAADVGGLRTLVTHGLTGFLVDGRTAGDYAAPVTRLLADRDLREEMAVSAVARAARFSWSTTAARLRRLYGDLAARSLVQCR